MKDIINKDGLQTRRTFFKKATKLVLPIIGVMTFSGMQNILRAADNDIMSCQIGCHGGCSANCDGKCWRSCEGGCNDNCAISCDTTCKDTCWRDACKGSCSGQMEPVLY